MKLAIIVARYGREVLGGAEKVRVPREPELLPPPMRASADEIAITRGSAKAITTAIARTVPRIVCEKFIWVSSIPDMGKCP